MNASSDGPRGDRNWGLLITVPVCLFMIVIFVVLFFSASKSPSKPTPLDPAWYTPETARGKELKNKVMVGNCYLCHAYWVGTPDPTVVRPPFAHVAIKLNHGANDRCYNCHLIQDRNKYTADDGSGIMAVNVEKLCARCHGLIYNDWKAGTHGLRRGKWDPRGPFQRVTFKCTQCHDPHSPAFKFKDFAPPPVWPAKFIRRPAVAAER